MKTKKTKPGFKVFLMMAFMLLAIPVITTVLPGQTCVVKAASNVKLNKTKATVIKGQTVQLKLVGATGKITWKSSDKKIAEVSSAGKVVTKAKGTVTITAENRNKKYSCKVEVETPKISKTAVTLYKDESDTLKMIGTKQKVIWKSSKSSVVSVNDKGKITAKATGTAVITATVSGKTYSCKVTVKTKTTVPVCTSRQTVYVNNSGYITLPNCFIYIKNLEKTAKVTDIKSTNPKIKAAKREELDAIEISGNTYSSDDLLGETSVISFKVIQNKKTYKLSCRIRVIQSRSPFAVFKIGTQNLEKLFEGSDYETAHITGKHKISIKMAQGYVMDYIYVLEKGKESGSTIENGSIIDFKNCEFVSVHYHTTKKPANYIPSEKWYGVVESPLHDYCNLQISDY